MKKTPQENPNNPAGTTVKLKVVESLQDDVFEKWKCSECGFVVEKR